MSADKFHDDKFHELKEKLKVACRERDLLVEQANDTKEEARRQRWLSKKSRLVREKLEKEVRVVRAALKGAKLDNKELKLKQERKLQPCGYCEVEMAPDHWQDCKAFVEEEEPEHLKFCKELDQLLSSDEECDLEELQTLRIIMTGDKK